MKDRIIAATPLISLLMFLFSGFVLDSWVLGLTFFLLIPFSWVLLSRRWKFHLVQLMPLISLMVFLWLALGLDRAHPGWLVFFAIPLSDVLINRTLSTRRLVTLSITLGYIALGVIIEGFWHPGWLMFLLIPIINTLFFPNSTVRSFTSSSQYYSSKVFEYVRTHGPEERDDVDIQDDEPRH